MHLWVGEGLRVPPRWAALPLAGVLTHSGWQLYSLALTWQPGLRAAATQLFPPKRQMARS